MTETRLKHLVLDIDHTLVGNACTFYYSKRPANAVGVWKGKYMLFRPGVIDFLQKCVDKFETVSLWTTSPRIWLNMFVDAVHKQNPDIQFYMKWAWENRTTHIKVVDGPYAGANLDFGKSLRAMCSSEKGCEAGMTLDNTVLVDDSIGHVHTNPKGSVLQIEAWDRLNNQDTALEKMWQTLITHNNVDIL